MSTRCNIIIKSGESKVFMYRHCDGYLAETGADIVRKLESAWGTDGAHYTPAGAADRFLRSLFSEYYDQQSYEKTPRRVYELTTGLHGDIEHSYTIDFKNGFSTGSVSIRHAARPDTWHKENMETDDWAWKGKRHTIDSLRDAVNQARKESNDRLARLRKDNGAYKDCEDYPMLQAPATQAIAA